MSKAAAVPDPAVFEKLGTFFLGRHFDAERNTLGPEPLLYDAKDLTTHAVCVGMTGSGKTGLCLSLLEEAALDRIPAIAIDPKGDLGNLLLTFPKLRPGDFRPWIDEQEAERKGTSPEQYAADTADKWRNGLADWGQDGARIGRLRDAAEFALYTPGSSAGLPVTVLGSFGAPPEALREDTDAFQERIAATVSGLLALLGIAADPITSREHILLSNLLDNAWGQGRDLDLGTLIREIQSPPLDRVGVMDLETFYPERDRVAFSMKLNNLLASPGFATWLEGEPLDVSRLLWTPEGKPRVAILSIAHLSDAERMFFVTLLLNEVLAWMRTQPGTSSLRALLYMDEVFGYFPPSAKPPSKTPMLTLLKQARAYGLGVVLATQNPVDLDYKGLSNAGTWFLGRLQTERDKERVLEGLEGASAAAGAGFDRADMDRILAGLKSRVFLLNNVHEDAPVLFHTRWAMSYLRGPLTRTQIQSLTEDKRKEIAQAPAAAMPRVAAAKPAAGADRGGARPAVPRDVRERFRPVTAPTPAGATLLYRPALLGVADLHYANARAGVDTWQRVACVAPLRDVPVGELWIDAEVLPDEPELHDTPEGDATFAELPSAAQRDKSYTSWGKALATHLYRAHALTLWKCAELKLTSVLGESEGEFRVRVREAARERRDDQMEKLRKRYAPKLKRLQERIRTAEERVGRESDQYSQQKMQTAISVGATVLGALLGRKAVSVGTVGRATTAMRGAGRAARERGDIARAQQRLKELHEQLGELEAGCADDTEELRELADPDQYELAEVVIRPRKSDITLASLTLLWTPWWVGADKVVQPVYQ